MIPVTSVFARSQKGVWGDKEWLPRNLSLYSRDFQESEEKKFNVVVMGRKTWETCPAQPPIPNCLHIVITKNPVLHKEISQIKNKTISFSSLDAALTHLNTSRPEVINKIFILGGYQIVTQALKYSTFLFVTQILEEPEENTDTNKVLSLESTEWYLQQVGKVQRKGTGKFFQLLQYSRKTSEQIYLEKMKTILQQGNERKDRTTIGTLSIWCPMFRHNLMNEFPLGTTKAMVLRLIAEELRWFILGQTDSKSLAEKKVHIWDPEGSRANLDKLGFTKREIGDLGPIYGFQWRHWGAIYENCFTNYKGKGIDQLKKVIQQIKEDPHSRRIILSSWNVQDLDKMVLPPCHVMVQFYVHAPYLSCFLFQRSGDMPLGVPYNVASYSLLTYLIAHVCNLKPCEFVHVIGDAHIYNNQRKEVEVQINRVPFRPPQLEIDPKLTNIDDFEFSHLKLKNYKSHAAIKFARAV